MLNRSGLLNKETAAPSVMYSSFKFYIMKKIFTLVFSLGVITAAFAQSGRRESRDVILGQDQNRTVYGNDGRNIDHNNGNFSTRERDEQISSVQREYNRKIQTVKRDHYLRSGEKRRQIHFLENERDARIRNIWQRYNDRSSRNYGRRY